MKPKVEDLGPAVVSFYRYEYNKDQRFGQFFINYYVPETDLPWPELFYEEDNMKAMDLILGYLEKGEK